MDDATGEAEGTGLRVAFDRRLKLEFHGASVTSDAGLLAFRELADALGLTELAAAVLTDSRTGNGRHSLLAAVEWIERVAALPGFRFVMPDRGTVLLSTRLPDLRPTDPTDPIDRMLLAAALRERIPLITADKGMISYARRTRHLSVCDARP